MPLDATPQPSQNHPVVQLLIEAQAYISDPNNWASGQYGLVEGPVCAIGSLIRATRRMPFDWDADYNTAYYLLCAYAQAHGCISMEHFNDTHSHQEVIEAFSAVIARARLLCTAEPVGRD